MKFVCALLAVSSWIVCSQAAVVEKVVAYEQGGVKRKGSHAYDNGFDGKRPQPPEAGEVAGKYKAGARSWEDMQQFFAEIFEES